MFWFYFLLWKGGYLKIESTFLCFPWIVVLSFGLLVFQSQGGSPLLHHLFAIDSSDWTNLIWTNWINFPGGDQCDYFDPVSKKGNTSLAKTTIKWKKKPEIAFNWLYFKGLHKYFREYLWCIVCDFFLLSSIENLDISFMMKEAKFFDISFRSSATE